MSKILFAAITLFVVLNGANLYLGALEADYSHGMRERVQIAAEFLKSYGFTEENINLILARN